MTAKSIPQPPMPPRVKRSKDYLYRVLEKNGYFIPQKLTFWGWINIKFTGDGVKCRPHGALSDLIINSPGDYSYRELSHAIWVIDYERTPKQKPLDKIHYL